MPSNSGLSLDRLTLTLIYDAPGIAPGELFEVGPYDPSVRTSEGGFMGPGFITIADSIPPLCSYTVTGGGTTTLTLTLSPPPGHSLAFDPWAFKEFETAVGVATIGGTPVSLILTMTGITTVGNNLIYTGASITGDGSTIAQMDPAPVEIFA